MLKLPEAISHSKNCTFADGFNEIRVATVASRDDISIFDASKKQHGHGSKNPDHHQNIYIYICTYILLLRQI